MSANLEAQVHGLNRLLHLSHQVRNAADLLEFGFITVNETHSIVPYRQGVLWRANKSGRGRIDAVSGVAVLDKRAPFIQWLTKVLNSDTSSDIKGLNSKDIPPTLADEWHDWLPENGLLLPLLTADHKLMGKLFLVREEPWQEYEITILQQITEMYSYTYGVLLGNKWYGARPAWIRRLLITTTIIAVLATLFLIPVNLSALAPGEIVPQQPTFIRSPLAGVVDKFFVVPNQVVTKNQPLFKLDDTTLRNRLEIARKSLAVANARVMQASKEAFFKVDVKAELTILKEQLEEQKAEVQYLQDLLEKIVVKADQDGIAIFTDVTEWLGRPVAVGERILVLAKPHKVELEINLPVANAITLIPETKVLFFLNIDPENTQEAKLSYASYQAQVAPNGVLAYRLKAQFNSNTPPQIGLRGTAKIYGKKTNIFYLIMRRPLAALRRKIGI